MIKFLAVMSLLSLPLFNANAERYEFETAPKHVTLTFESLMEIEDILGTSHSIQGGVDFDKGTFKVRVPVSSLKTGIEMRDEHIQGEMWLNAAEHPYLQFQGDKIEKLDEKKIRLSGLFTAKGVSTPLTTVAQIRRIPAALAKRLGLGDGDWLRVRAQFKVKLSEHNIQIPKMAAAKVNNTWIIKVSMFGRGR